MMWMHCLYKIETRNNKRVMIYHIISYIEDVKNYRDAEDSC